MDINTIAVSCFLDFTDVILLALVNLPMKRILRNRGLVFRPPFINTINSSGLSN